MNGRSASPSAVSVTRPFPGPRWKRRTPELALEQADLSAQRGLGEVQPLRRLREVAILGHRHHIAELMQLHIS